MVLTIRKLHISPPTSLLTANQANMVQQSYILYTNYIKTENKVIVTDRHTIFIMGKNRDHDWLSSQPVNTPSKGPTNFSLNALLPSTTSYSFPFVQWYLFAMKMFKRLRYHRTIKSNYTIHRSSPQDDTTSVDLYVKQLKSENKKINTKKMDIGCQNL